MKLLDLVGDVIVLNVTIRCDDFTGHTQVVGRVRHCGKGQSGEALWIDKFCFGTNTEVDEGTDVNGDTEYSLFIRSEVCCG